MGEPLTLRQKLLLLMDEIEEDHNYDIIRGRCSCGFRTRDVNVIKHHYVDQVVALFEAEGLSLP